MLKTYAISVAVIPEFSSSTKIRGHMRVTSVCSIRDCYSTREPTPPPASVSVVVLPFKIYPFPNRPGRPCLAMLLPIRQRMLWVCWVEEKVGKTSFVVRRPAIVKNSQPRQCRELPRGDSAEFAANPWTGTSRLREVYWKLR